MSDIKLVEGEYQHGYILTDKYDNIGEEVDFRVRICRNIYSTGKVLILYSKLCLFWGIVELIKLVFIPVILSKRDGIGPPWYLVIPSTITSPSRMRVT